MKILAIDPSFTSTGICSFESVCAELWGFETWTTGKKLLGTKSSKKDGFVLRTIFSHFNNLNKTDWDLVLMERPAYGYGSGRQIKGPEVAGVIKAALYKYDIYEVASNTWKKLVIGSGRANKKGIKDYCEKELNLSFSTQDEYDAYCIGAMAIQCIENNFPHEGTLERGQEVANEIRGYMK